MNRPVWLRLVALCLPLAVFGVGSWQGIQSPPDLGPAPAQQLGFTFSYREAQWYGLLPEPSLQRLLVKLEPDVVRLPVYWWDSEPSMGQYDWSATDRLVDVISAYNRQGHNVRVVMTLGERNLRFPEDYRPRWIAGMAQGEFLNINDTRVQRPLRVFLGEAGRHFRNRPELVAWQLENEPFDPVALEGEASRIAPATLRGEYLAIKHADASHPILVTSYIAVHSTADVLRNSGGYLALLPLPGLKGPGAGHPLTALGAGDAMGLDVYFVPANWIAEPHQLDQLFIWNLEICESWAAAVHARSEQFWVTEFQAEPWVGNESYGPAQLLRGWRAFSPLHADGVLFWGAEYWAAHPDWLAAAERIFAARPHTRPPSPG
jgi:hypothetical protein